MSLRTSLGDAWTGLRRNASMAIALIVTLTVSLMLVAMGLLLNQQADRTEHYFGDRLQILVYMCAEHSTGANCTGGDDGRATEEQIDEVEEVLGGHDEVSEVERRSAEENYEIAEVLATRDEITTRGFEELEGPEEMYESFVVTLDDPLEFEGVVAEVEVLGGVDSISDWRDVLGPLYNVLDRLQWIALGSAALLTIAAVLQVSNTIRMTAIVRRREIGIMRLVGASQWHIQWPFILEAVVAALVSAALAAGGLAAFMHYIVFGYLHESFGHVTAWVGWPEALLVMGYTTAISLVLALVPTLFVTRRYLDV